MHKIVVLILLTFFLLVPSVCYAGLGEPLPSRDESAQAANERLRAALLRESRIGGDADDYEDSQGMMLSMMAGLLLFGIIFLLLWAFGCFDARTPPHFTHLGVITSGSAAGMHVTYVEPVSAAQDAGIEVGDIITEFAGKKYTNENEFIKAIGAHKIGETVKVKVLRGDSEIELKVKLRPR